MRPDELSLYQKSVLEIKTEVRKYSNISVFMRTIESLHMKNPNSIHGYMRLPWNSVLLLKWKLCDEFAPLGSSISLEDFARLVNKLHQLQVNVIDLQSANPTLSLRPMLINQIFYQQAITDYLANLTRLFIFFNENSSEAEYCRNIFNESFGLRFSVFYVLARGVISHFESGNNTSLSLEDFFCAFYPTISAYELAKFIGVFSFVITGSPSFLSEFKTDEPPLWEYFETTPFGRCPLVLHEDRLFCIHPKILAGAFCNAVPEILKKNYRQKFKERFGILQERYIRKLLDEISDSVIDENEIKKMYLDKNKKAVDYLIDQGGVILIESKAIEPTSIVNTSSDPAILAKNLSASFIGAINQGQESCFELKRSGKFFSKEFFLLVVINKEYYIPSANYLHEHIEPALSEKFIDAYGSIPIPLDRIFYITLGDLENIKLISLERGIKLSSMIKQWSSRQLNRRDQRVNTTHYISDCHGKPRGKSDISEFGDSISLEICKTICSNNFYNSNRDILKSSVYRDFLGQLS